MDNNIEGKIVVITGVRSGLGEAAARPESGRYAPARIFISVLFPAPFSPIRA